MLRMRLAAVGLFAVLLAGRYGLAFDAPVADGGPLQGKWAVVSVERDGAPDPTQIGSVVAFTGHTATFQPKAFTLDASTFGSTTLVQLDGPAVQRIIDDGTR